MSAGGTMRRAAGLGLALLAAGCAAPSVRTTAPGMAPVAVQPATARDDAAPALAAIRRAAGHGALRRDDRLDAAARGHALYMQRSGRMGHDGQGGSGPMERVRGQGLLACFAAENVAEGYGDLPRVLRAWMASPGHRANILDPRATLFGMARAGDYWTMLTAAPCPQGAVLSPTDGAVILPRR
ncbi:CAP domain-containing protein [Profundibacterium mesophilum]|uniref:SCP domain-containing protein n=1 Tax=Profundibacterium mesophilum KAUST100406-0324 TaxID=1037889 RepID=A0A921NTT0_9RHOB|nr:CAP domain-containing protein [Profundibacterium mesophilum]KAF0675400.1 uncharacterized protein PMES_02290 [Profundibacterium mesophilum KAUST100406-0324]